MLFYNEKKSTDKKHLKQLMLFAISKSNDKNICRRKVYFYTTSIIPPIKNTKHFDFNLMHVASLISWFQNQTSIYCRREFISSTLKRLISKVTVFVYYYHIASQSLYIKQHVFTSLSIALLWRIESRFPNSPPVLTNESMWIG